MIEELLLGGLAIVVVAHQRLETTIRVPGKKKPRRNDVDRCSDTHVCIVARYVRRLL